MSRNHGDCMISRCLWHETDGARSSCQKKTPFLLCYGDGYRSLTLDRTLFQFVLRLLTCRYPTFDVALFQPSLLTVSTHPLLGAVELYCNCFSDALCRCLFCFLFVLTRTANHRISVYFSTFSS